jgi:hypothetical protein
MVMTGCSWEEQPENGNSDEESQNKGLQTRYSVWLRDSTSDEGQTARQNRG